MAEYVSIKRFAELADVSPQSIYKRLKKENNPLQPFVKRVEGKKPMISMEALSLYEDNEEPVIHIEEPEQQTSSNDLIEKAMTSLQDQLVYQQDQLKEKDKQIELLLKRLEETNKALDQQQKLSAADKQRILELETKEAESEKKVLLLEETIQIKEAEANKKWYQKLFG
jgi:hypothetical protein